RSLWLGTIGIALSLGLVLVLLVFVVHEGAALARLSRIDALRKQTLSLDTRRLLPGLKRLYADRHQLEAAAQTVQKAVRESPDAETLIATAERAYLTALDRDAELAVSSAARDVAAATALIPMPAVDVAAVLWINLRMIRRVGEVYGGRSGWFGSLRLLRAVATHLIATGAIAATDDVLGPLIGGGILGTLSRRFGEAAVNAALTARVGVAAIEVCRPMPHQHLVAPRASGLVAHALRGWRATKSEA
ncbi:MAG: YcjF family protein, partial [Pseudomonadota bacterium]